MQAKVVDALAALADRLVDYAPAAAGAGWLDRLRGRDRRAVLPRGLYLHGPVGRGKSMLMELFFDAVPVAAKRRVHFHALMLEIHARLDRQRQRAGAAGDPLVLMADVLVGEAWLLCFDEFHVHDIADAMILGRLFEALEALGSRRFDVDRFPGDTLREYIHS
jgi:cell division protein ZapE